MKGDYSNSTLGFRVNLHKLSLPVSLHKLNYSSQQIDRLNPQTSHKRTKCCACCLHLFGTKVCQISQ